MEAFRHLGEGWIELVEFSGIVHVLTLGRGSPEKAEYSPGAHTPTANRPTDAWGTLDSNHVGSFSFAVVRLHSLFLLQRRTDRRTRRRRLREGLRRRRP